MATHTFTKHLYQVHFDFADEPCWKLMDSGTMADEEWLYVGPREITVEVPEFQDMRDHQVAALRAKETKLRADFQKSITDIHARIQSLLALEMA